MLETAPAPARFDVPLSGSVDIAGSLEVFRRAGDDRLDRWDGATLVRTAATPVGAVAYTCTPAGTLEAPILRVTAADAGARAGVERAAGWTLGVAPPEFAALVREDPVIGRLERQYPGVRPARQGDLFAALVRSISAQQVNLRWAATTRKRLAEAFGTRHLVDGREVYSLDAERLAAADPAAIRALQFTTRKAEYIVGLAGEVASGRLSLAELRALRDDEAIARLTALRGIGRWTAEWMLARTLGRPRVVAGDLGVRKAVGLAYGRPRPSEKEVRELTAHWGRSAEIAQALVLHGLAEGAFG